MSSGVSIVLIQAGTVVQKAVPYLVAAAVAVVFSAARKWELAHARAEAWAQTKAWQTHAQNRALAQVQSEVQTKNQTKKARSVWRAWPEGMLRLR